MKNQTKLISELIINLISIFLALYFWKFISLPYKNIGIIGEYLSRVYQETKKRPKFIIEDKSIYDRNYHNDNKTP